MVGANSSVDMPTGSGKSNICKYLRKLVEGARKTCGLDENSPSWYIDDQSFEKMVSMMQENGGRLLGIYDEVPMFVPLTNECFPWKKYFRFSRACCFPSVVWCQPMGKKNWYDYFQLHTGHSFFYSIR